MSDRESGLDLLSVRVDQVSPALLHTAADLQMFWSGVDSVATAMTEKAIILVVEDDPLVSEVIAAALDDEYQVRIVASSADAMDSLRSGGVTLMLLDCTLPGGVDDDLIPEADRGGAAVVLMSGDPGRMANLTDQARPFVLKPFTLAGLLGTVRDVLSSAGR
jgi:DNA-binding response OmpR family regulator